VAQVVDALREIVDPVAVVLGGLVGDRRDPRGRAHFTTEIGPVDEQIRELCSKACSGWHFGCKIVPVDDPDTPPPAPIPAPDLDPREWDAIPTVIETEPVTSPRDVSQLPGYAVGRLSGFAEGREAGCRGCWLEAQRDALEALRRVLVARGLSDDQTAHVVLAVRLQMTAL
jgi:hypothetical protein